ncbi:MAG: thymidylate synthase [Candidatus Colwellbacteria bacterium CG10_big_fil_rev_8_21_14_0_10_42_22]|uniref:Thymidylate synthase n=1 Tax=Candidatus Colwellbacteria bacterium CG10_big_fil_rev_8_21_14_0_10_42_22 TaxID=1974540 RepID=A0A2H0VHB9_9BACT|nr:MAG: thymidylate synthase [Candidatus Colwellbacteria bacterium CG10_big_fil_rev_8_21_14_0_10_42_22]
MKQYLDLVEDVLQNGKRREKTLQGSGDLSVFVRTKTYPVSEDAFPVLTTKKINFHNVVVELLWFLSGESRWDYLHKYNVKIWDVWGVKEVAEKYGLEEGDFGPIYGPNWIHWPDVKRDGELNQIKRLVEELRKNPDSRRHKVVAYNPASVDDVMVAPCHGDFKCYVDLETQELHLNMVQRSADVPIGVPYNISSYSLLLVMLAQVTGYKPGNFIHTTQDTHIYLDQVDPIKEQLTREPRRLPKLKINKDVKDIFEFKPDDFELEGYDPHPFIKIPVGI